MVERNAFSGFGQFVPQVPGAGEAARAEVLSVRFGRRHCPLFQSGHQRGGLQRWLVAVWFVLPWFYPAAFTTFNVTLTLKQCWNNVIISSIALGFRCDPVNSVTASPCVAACA